MYKKSFLRPILIIGLITVIFASCDKDFNEIGTDIVGDDHFGFEQYTDATINSFNQKLGPISSNNLPINPLGFYNNPVFGDTRANFVTQVELGSDNPKFNNTTPGDYSTEAGHGPTVLDSVIMEIPYFVNAKKTKVDPADSKKRTYVLDSIFGETPYDQTAATANAKFKLSVYQSNYYLRDLDPSQSLTEQQLFYTDQEGLIEGSSPILLNDAPLANIPAQGIKNADGHENSSFYFDKREHKTDLFEDDGSVSADSPRSVPSMRLHLNKTIFDNLILHAPSGQLANSAVFKNYFRGIYFKVEDGNPGNMAMINFKGGKITLYYNEDKKDTSTTPPTYERVNKTFVLNLAGNTISFLNTTDNPTYLNAASSTLEASKLYLKGGEGSMAVIDLFGSVDNYRYDVLKLNGIPVDESGHPVPLDAHDDPITGHYLIYTKTNIANGIPDELDDLRYPLINDNSGQIYHSIKNRWMINEANLTFNIDQAAMSNEKAVEPNRIFLYDLDNKKTLVDYIYDNTTDGLYPKRNKFVYGGILVNSDGTVTKQIKNDATGRTTQKGYKYKIRITNHIRNLIKNDSTNVRLGLSVTENINNIGFSKLRMPNANTDSAPSMSVLNQLGTILYGTNIPFGDADYDKRLKLEIYYTKPN